MASRRGHVELSEDTRFRQLPSVSIWPSVVRRVVRRRETMRVMVIVPGSRESEAGVLPDTKILAEMGQFNEELVKAGVLLAGEGLEPTSEGKRVRFSGSTPTVIDGPFAESKELVAGFWLWQVKSMDEAIAWIKRAAFGGGVEIEIRRVFETEDFGDAMTPEISEQENRMRAWPLAAPK